MSILVAVSFRCKMQEDRDRVKVINYYLSLIYMYNKL